MRLAFATCGIVLCFAATAFAQTKPELVSVKKIWDGGKHNAFTDLARWHDKFWVTFREGDGHVGCDGKIRVLVSEDGDKWESAGLLSEESIDLRDPKLSVTPDDRLMVVMGGSDFEGSKLVGRFPRVAFSKDGREWTAPQKMQSKSGLGEGHWLWRVVWHEGVGYGVSYSDAPKKEKETSDENVLELYQTKDGLNYDLVAKLDVTGQPNEVTPRFLKDGRLMLLVRREAGSHFGWIGTSSPPYREWKWNETKLRIGGPNFIELPSGELWGVVRTYSPQVRTQLVQMTEKSLAPVVEFPSGGDTSYAGLVWHDDLLWVSYYSSHEGKTSIYLAKVKFTKS